MVKRVKPSLVISKVLLERVPPFGVDTSTHVSRKFGEPAGASEMQLVDAVVNMIVALPEILGHVQAVGDDFVVLEGHGGRDFGGLLKHPVDRSGGMGGGLRQDRVAEWVQIWERKRSISGGRLSAFLRQSGHRLLTKNGLNLRGGRLPNLLPHH